MNPGLLWGCGAVAFGLLLFVTLIGWTRRLQHKTVKRVRKTLGGERILGLSSNALYFGRESLGMAQVRGNGVLAMTEERLYFQMWTPKREISIPFDWVVTVETPRSHLGKTKGRHLLKVVFESDGKRDSCAWLLRDLDSWKAAVEKNISAENACEADI